MKINCAIFAALMALFGIAAQASASIKAPKSGTGIVVMQLIQPERIAYNAIKQDMLAGKKGNRYRADPEKLKSKTMEQWRLVNNVDYGVLIGTLKPETKDYDVVEGVWDYTPTSGAIISSSFDLYKDEVNDQLFYIAEVPAGEAVIYGLNVQNLWQIRFDAGAPHFTVPDGGYIFLGTFDGTLNRERVIEAIESGSIPKVISGHSRPVAACQNVVQGFEGATNTDINLRQAEEFLKFELGMSIKLNSTTVDIVPFQSRVNGGFVKATTHYCANK